ncbi:prestalk A differentiation A [Apiospora marii]|uniref:prestalk A differentiation A n=1 Tax=Apiospora marii TaxID=335849 RepID=UPI0031313658
MLRHVCITAVDGNTGYTIAELLLSAPFKSKVGTVVGLALDDSATKAKEFTALGGKLVSHKPGRMRDVVKTLKETGCDVLCLIPPAHHNKKDITEKLIHTAKKANIPNVCIISSIGCDYADPKKQPHIREFIKLESLFLSSKGDASTETGHSPVIIRAGFYAENLLLYAPQAQSEGVLPLPIGKKHKFAPVALRDVAQVAAHVLTGRGEHSFDDRHRGQMMVVTELATAASEALGSKMEFESISESEAKKVLKSQSESDQSELQYLLEYYNLVKEGKANYISTTAFVNMTGDHPTEPVDFFKMYRHEMEPAAKRAKRAHK